MKASFLRFWNDYIPEYLVPLLPDIVNGYIKVNGMVCHTFGGFGKIAKIAKTSTTVCRAIPSLSAISSWMWQASQRSKMMDAMAQEVKYPAE